MKFESEKEIRKYIYSLILNGTEPKLFIDKTKEDATPIPLIQVNEDISYVTIESEKIKIDVKKGDWLKLDSFFTNLKKANYFFDEFRYDFDGYHGRIDGISLEDFNETYIPYNEKDKHFEDLKNITFRIKMYSYALTDIYEKYVNKNERLIEEKAQFEKIKPISDKVDAALFDLGFDNVTHEEMDHYGPDTVYDYSYFLGYKYKFSWHEETNAHLKFVERCLGDKEYEISNMSSKIYNNNVKITDLEGEMNKLNIFSKRRKNQIKNNILALQQENETLEKRIGIDSEMFNAVKKKYDSYKDLFDTFKEEYKKPGASGFQFLDERLDENVKRYWRADLYNKYYDEFEHSRETLEMIYENELRGNEYVNGKYVKKYELAFQDARGLKEAVEIAKHEGKDFNSLSVKDKIAYFLDGVKKIKKLDEINQQTDKEKDND